MSSPILASMVGLMNEHPTLARLFFSCGLLLELFAFLTLGSRNGAAFSRVSGEATPRP